MYEKASDTPLPYSEEVMTGFEYAYAGSLLQCGMENEALTVVRAIRDRYDGQEAQPVQRDRMRRKLCARDGELRAAADLQRFPVRYDARHDRV